MQGGHCSDGFHGIRVDNGNIAEAMINGRISNEAKIVIVDNDFPQCLWSRYFIKEQWYTVKELVFCQENMSSMLMEKNGKESSMKRTKHIWLQYLFIKYRIKKRACDWNTSPQEKHLHIYSPDHCKEKHSGDSRKLYKEYLISPRMKTWAAQEPCTRSPNSSVLDRTTNRHTKHPPQGWDFV